MELAYIYFMVSKKHYNDGKKKNRATKIQHDVGLPSDWKPDDKIETAIAMLTHNTKSLAERMYTSVLENLLVAIDAMDSLRDVTVNMLDQIQEQLSKGKLNKDTIDLYDSATKKLKDDIGYVLKMSKDVPDAVDKAKKLLEQVEEEEKTVQLMRGVNTNEWENDDD